MKVAIVNKFFFVKGGQESVMFDEADFLEKKGHQVGFFSMHHPENISDYYYSKYFVDYVDLSEAGKGYSFFEKLLIAKNFIYNKKASIKFEAFLNDFKPDIIHCHGIAHQISPSILLVAKRYNIPVVQTLHDYQIICPNYTFMSGGVSLCSDHRCIKGSYYYSLLYRCIKKSYLASFLGMLEAYFNKINGIYLNNIDRFIAPSIFLKEMIVNSGINVDKVLYIPNFVQEYRGLVELDNHNYFLYVGRLSYEKGLITLLKAFKDCPFAKLKIVGKGPLEAELLNLKEQYNLQNVEFIGAIPREGIDIYIRSCAALILPSGWYENAPISILEAFSMGKPVIGANIGGIPEMIKDGYNGFLFNVADVDSLKSKIDILLNNTELSEELGKNAKKYYYERFNKEKHMEKLLQLYESLLR